MLVAFIGETAVGKTTVMELLQKTRNYLYVRNVTTRHSRFGEYHKSTISNDEFDLMNSKGELILTNEFFGKKYGYLRADIDHALSSQSVTCMIDFGIENINQLDSLGEVAKVIILPDSEFALKSTLEKSNRGRDVGTVIAAYRAKYSHLTEGYNESLGAFVVRNIHGDVGATAYLIAEFLSGISVSPQRSPNERGERLKYILENLNLYRPAASGLEAYKFLTEAIDKFEDRFTLEAWAPPRTFLDGSRTTRMYTIFPESFLQVSGFSGVTLLLSKSELVFISKNGAIQIQEKDPGDLRGEITHFSDREERVVFDKKDSLGNNVWHASNV